MLVIQNQNADVRDLAIMSVTVSCKFALALDLSCPNAAVNTPLNYADGANWLATTIPPRKLAYYDCPFRCHSLREEHFP